MDVRDELREVLAAYHSDMATGCIGAGGYRAWAQAQGYQYVRTLCNSSSAGDWSFLISKNGDVWQLMWQENNWPRPGFSRYIEPKEWVGSFEEVVQQMEELYAY